MGIFDWNGNGEHDLFDVFVTRSLFKSVERAERKARRRQEFWAAFWDGVFNGNKNCSPKYKSKSVEKWKPSKAFKVMVKILLVLLGIVMIYAKLSNM